MSGNAEVLQNESSKVRINYSFTEKPLTRIIIAEDQIINMEVIKSQIREEGLLDRCEFCFNGQEAIEKAQKVIIEAIDSETGWSASIMPVCLMLLDF
jgi:CheY-like chemotaxis protein